MQIQVNLTLEERRAVWRLRRRERRDPRDRLPLPVRAQLIAIGALREKKPDAVVLDGQPASRRSIPPSVQEVYLDCTQNECSTA